MKKLETRILGFTFIFAGILMVIHHFIISGRLFDLKDILHHEFFEAIAFTAGIVLILTTMFENN
ncbi:MAG: hypothetical protein IAX21_07950 [Candidatus Bathyarchaeota archaeon]|nr:hypothetical protein [Candidatus Bathyarchaeum tardum]WGM89176.1 MAG: hypothetical protein NUK63_09730 [Candidatus Bathyarchaeum tardum]WNZ28584.1 MAG: hypothetical protein IAX21_07950 [Candidatus Bathyarchaeota archaeon]